MFPGKPFTGMLRKGVTMKFKRQGSLLLSILMAFSLCLSCFTRYPVTVYAQENPCVHHPEHTAECGYVQGGPGSLCTHVCSEESGCLKVACVHEHDETCGYTEGDEESCTHVCSEESGCITKECTHEHDESCGYAEEIPGHPCEFVCDLCDCTCTSRCADGAGNPTCPVCAENPQNCTFTAVTVDVNTGSGYAPCGAEGAKIEISLSIDGDKVETATVDIALTEQEAALVQLPGDEPGWTLENNTLTLTLTRDAGENPARKTVQIPVAAAEPAVVDLAGEDISVRFTPDTYMGSDLVSTGVTGGRLSFVDALPTEDAYGSGTEFAARVDAVTVLYVDSEGQPSPRQERAPDFTLYYQVEGQQSAALQGDALPFGLAAAPQLTVTAGEDRWTGTVQETVSLPSRVLALENGAYVEKAVRWYLEPSYPPEYYPGAGTLVNITADNASRYPGNLAPGWYYMAGEEPYPEDTVEVTEYLDALSHSVYWADNGNVDQQRPASIREQFALEYAFDGSSDYTRLTQDGLAQLGLTGMPQPQANENGGIWTYNWKENLPGKVTYVDGVSGKAIVRSVAWRVVFAGQVENYSMVEVDAANAHLYPSVGTNYGTYFVLNTALTFHVRIFRGNTRQGENLRTAFVEQFYLDAAYTGDNHQYYQLAAMEDYIATDGHEGEDAFSITVSNLWRYNLDNTRINYSVREGIVLPEGGVQPDSTDERVDGVQGLDAGDYFRISYDNSAVPSFSGETDGVYGGGTLKLTLTGHVDYKATKTWLDDGNAANRPAGEMELWRYRSEEAFTTASVVRDEAGKPYIVTLDTTKDSQEISFDNLSKYDPEGYAYCYGAREYLSGNNAGRYEQVFGKVGEDGSVTDTCPAGERPANDTYLYNGGTLSNRLYGSVPVTVTKDWKAASFQSEFEDVKVVMRLQSRYKGTEAPWQDTGYTHDMFGFIAENLTMTYTGAYPQYDARGKELEYRWVEAEVWQGGRVENDTYTGGTVVESSQEEDGTRLFVLKQNDREVTYRSTAEADPGAQNHTRITNTIANVVQYEVVKEFEPEWNAAQYAEEYRFSLFRTTSGSRLERYLTFTVDKDMGDEAPRLTFYGTDSPVPTIVQTGEWKVKISGLREFDADGQQYQYLLLEENGAPLTMDTYRDEKGNYSTTVYNGPGTGNIILIRKEWIDESDSQHRLPVTATVYDRATDKAVATVTLSEDNAWYDIVGIGNLGYEDVYVLETQVGDSSVTTDPPSPPVYQHDAEGQDPTRVIFSTEYHNYEVTYDYDEDFGAEEGGTAFRGVHCFTITNRRLGNIDLTVEKNWLDGEGESRNVLRQALENSGLHLAVKLDFMTEPSLGLEKVYNITRTGQGGGDTVTISPGNPTPIRNNEGEPVASLQALDLDQKNQTLYFWNLPKYDANGASVRYTVEEVFLDETGGIVAQADLAARYPAVAEAYKEYSLSLQQGPYVVGDHHARDTQEFTLTNKRSGTVDVAWYTLWLDQFSYEEDTRPDVYLNIYQRTHKADGTTQTELCIRNYRWIYEETEEEGINERNFWKCTIEGLPKYDALGYEIDYFAVMNSMVSAADFDYLETGYSEGKADTAYPTVFATADRVYTGTTEENKNRVEEISGDAAAPVYALKSGNTFINTIYDTITYSGEKLWTNLPQNYPMVDLPAVTFTLNRSTAGGTTEEAIATMTIRGSDWESLNVSGHYVFAFGHTGENEPASAFDPEAALPQGAILLPRFDHMGALYHYTIEESVDWDGTDAAQADQAEGIFETSSTGQTVTNGYYDGTAQLSAVKHLTLPVGQSKYPAIRMVLTRTYTTHEGTPSAEETVTTLTWNAAEVAQAVQQAGGTTGSTVTVTHTFTFTDLPVYAPNGSRYSYAIAEDKSQLGGFDTWSAAGEKTAAELETDGTAEQLRVEGLTPHTDAAVDASFLNRPENTPDPIQLTGGKVWNDLNDAFGFRPEVTAGLTIRLERRANAQTGQNNAIPWQEVTDQYSITWAQDGSKANRWSYTLSGLERYAPNGMPWIYRVTEDPVPSCYTAGSSGSASQKSQDGTTGNITMNDLTNSLLTSTSFRKNWVDSDGNAVTANVLGQDLELEVTYALQVRASEETGGTGYSGWKAAETFFADTLAQSDTSGLRERTYTGTIRAALGASPWNQTYRGQGNSFNNLPRYIRDAAGTVYTLQYRVVETAVKVYRTGEETPLLTLTYTVVEEENDRYHYTVSTAPAQGNTFIVPYYGKGADAQPNSTTTHKNQLQTTRITVAKQWQGDNNTVYLTRPASTNSRYDWEVTLTIQRSTDNGRSWEALPTGSRVTLHGTNGQDRVEQTVTGLPSMAFDQAGNLVPCQYRVVELQSQQATEDGNVREELETGDTFHYGYTVGCENENNICTAVNTLNTVDLQATKVWNDEASTHPAVTLELKYLKADGNAEQAGDYLSFAPAARVTLNGQADANTATALYYEESGWKAVWKAVPQTLPGSKLDAEGKTIYKIFETVPGNYLVETSPMENGETTITNTPTVTPGVTKHWLGVDAASSVTVELWRKTDTNPNGEKVAQATLTAAEDWTCTFKPQPMYSSPANGSAGELYTYWVKETQVGAQDAAEAAEEGGYAISYGGTAAAGFHVYNHDLDTLYVIKDWADSGDPAARPAALTLTLQRTTAANPAEKDWTTVTDASYTWVKDGSQWTTQFADLPVYDIATQLPYQYRVLETVPEGYTQTVITDADNTFHFRNVRWELTDLPVRKVWDDNGDAFHYRPASIQLELYADGQPTGKVLTLKPNGLQSLWNTLTGDDAGWSGVFEDLPKYDDDGALIRYTVVETQVPEHYEVLYGQDDGTLVVTNRAYAQLTVSKKLTGNGADPAAEFHFTLTLSDDSITGRYGELTFDEGVATFTLKGGQHLTAADLPAGITYTVTEQEADRDAYQTESSGTTGELHAGQTAQAVFTNDWTKISIPVTKRWDDSNNRYGKRPASVRVELLADGNATGRTLELSEGNRWHGSFDGLDVFDDGKEIHYTIREVTVENYSVQIRGSAAQGFELVNRYTGTTDDTSPKDPAPPAGANGIPGTEDPFNLTLWAILCGGSLLALVFFLARKRKNSRSDNHR